MTIAFRRDSFCGKMSACNNLTQYGIPFSLTALHTVSPDSAEFDKDLAWFSAVCRVKNGLNNLRIGSIGARPAPSIRSATVKRFWSRKEFPSRPWTCRKFSAASPSCRMMTSRAGKT